MKAVVPCGHPYHDTDPTDHPLLCDPAEKGGSWNNAARKDHEGARVVTLTEEPAYEFYEMFVKTPKRVFIEWEGVQE